MTFLSLLLGSLSTAHAVPVQLTQQGRMLDSSGAAVNGLHLMTFRLFDNQVGGNMAWEESLQVGFTEGYYMAVLGANVASYPLDDSVLADFPLYLEVEIDGGGPIGTRQAVVSTPYARLSGSATNLSGGTVDASQVSVGGQLVIDANGSWVGPVQAVNWTDVQGIPADIADGDDDTLSGISCVTGDILGWNGTTWTCAADNGLTEAEVELFVSNDAIDLHANTTVGGLPILTQGDGGTLSGLACQDGELAKWDQVLGQWNCGADMDTNTQLTEGDVEAFVVNDAIDLAAGSMMGGATILTDADVLTPDWTNLINVPSDIADGDDNTDTLSNMTCNAGEVLTFDPPSSQWVCTAILDLLDGDGDGFLITEDCDDTDASIQSSANDSDCDGLESSIDCDDNDASNTNSQVDDGDCDGLIFADDCDDSDPNATAVANDADCDGSETASDCNDSDASIYPNATEVCDDGIDQDCDGVDESCPGYTNGLGGTYLTTSADITINAQLACESVFGAGNCCNDGCGSCNGRGYHQCGAPNCNGSIYWNYQSMSQSMDCGWVDPNEILVSSDGVNWAQ